MSSRVHSAIDPINPMKREYRTAEQGISNVEENTYFIVLHSLFDIRYLFCWVSCLIPALPSDPSRKNFETLWGFTPTPPSTLFLCYTLLLPTTARSQGVVWLSFASHEPPHPLTPAFSCHIIPSRQWPEPASGLQPP